MITAVNITIKTIYFAGPDVFRPDVDVWRARVIKLCSKYGVTPLLPCDGIERYPEAIRNANLTLLRSASAVIANLSPFRGAEVDTGTAFEVGYACALQKPMIGFIEEIESNEDRVMRLFGPLTKSESSEFAFRDCNGFGVESFNLPTNLMIAAGMPIVAGDEERAMESLLAHKNQHDHGISGDRKMTGRSTSRPGRY